MNWLIHHTKRVLRITSGIVVLVIGVVLMVPGVPGPGFLLVLLGLSILAVDFIWASRLKTYLKDQAGKILRKMRGRSKKERPAKKV